MFVREDINLDILVRIVLGVVAVGQIVAVGILG